MKKRSKTEVNNPRRKLDPELMGALVGAAMASMVIDEVLHPKRCPHCRKVLHEKAEEK